MAEILNPKTKNSGRTSGKMAQGLSRSVVSEDKILQKNMNFESEIKMKLSWTKEKWFTEGESDTGKHKFVNSLRYWAKELEKAQTGKNVIITLFDSFGGAEFNLPFILEAILKLKKDIKIVAFSEFRNSKYIAFYFEDAETRIFVEQNLKKANGKHVAFISWALGPVARNVKVSWVPYHIDISEIKNEIEKYATVLEGEREMRNFMSGLAYPTGIINFKVVIKDNIDIEEIPPVTKVSGFDCLMTIQGKEIICLTCDKKGHKSAQCPTHFCGKCKALKEIKHLCIEAKEVESNVQAEGDGIQNPGCLKDSTFENSVNLFKRDKESEQVIHEKKMITILKTSDDVREGKNCLSDTNIDDRKNWSDSSEDEKSVEEHTNNSVTLVEGFLKELNKFKAPIQDMDIEKTNMSTGQTIVEDTVHKSKKDSKMEVDRNLKRNLDPDVVEWGTQHLVSTTRKTYSKRGGSRKHLPKDVGVNLFNVSRPNEKK